MPQKSSMRSWGTRFDTLPTSPPVSPPLCDPAVGPQSSALDDPSDPKLTEKKEDKMPHDASVFVGSLPSAIDQQELSRLLSEHLSEHTEVKNIKVVRDSKGGVCAFVQCEHAASAAKLIHTLHSNPPKPFLGRTLRYEPARAFRTLLISYRTPVQYIPFNRETRSTGNDLPKAGQTVELDLPNAMRVWKPRNSKFVSLLYNAEAVDAENHSRTNQALASENASLFLQPVTYDAEAIRKLAMYFGRLECFDTYNLSDRDDASDDIEKWKRYPSPHDCPRSTGMDVGCWEVKWDHRDDCVSALMSLRRVPHLTVTWAHQPPPFGFEQRSPYPNRSPHLTAVSYPLHVQDRLQSLRGQPPSSTNLFCSIESDSLYTGSHTITAAADGLSKESIPPSTKTEDDNDDDDWIAQTAGHDIHPGSLKALEDPTPKTDEWSEMDFPPLSKVQGQAKTEHGVWSEKITSIRTSPRSSPSTASQLASPREVSFATLGGSLEVSFQPHCQVQELEMPPTPGLGMSPITPKTPGSLFPITPTEDTSGLHTSAFKEYDGKEHEPHGDSDRNERELDPTTLFVGGLETFGPGAWDEAKVERFFARFGGLESVKVVRPANSHAAFAFVKFNNTESPARAVFEEHNRVYEGRAMRVQLRECNPPRGPWRHSRGRGRFQQHFNTHRRFPDHFDGKPTERLIFQEGLNRAATAGSPPSVIPPDSSNKGDGPEQPAYVDKNSAQSEEEIKNDRHGRNQSTDSQRSTPEPSAAPIKTLSQSEGYHEWYDEPLSAALTPPPSSFSSSTSTTIPPPALSYPIGSGYYVPPPWLHPYAQQMPYPMPYFPFPGYPVAGQPVSQVFTSLPATDTTGSTTAVQNPWPSAGMYGSYIPYPPQQATQPASTANVESQHLDSRAPLAPTGFIQNEHGTLIAVYQPEALDRYMAGRVVPPAVPQANWQSFPPSHSYPYPVPPPLSSRPFPSSANMGWSTNTGLIPPQAPQHVPPHLNPQNPAVAFRGAYNDMGGQANGPGYRRPPVRRDQGHTYNHGRYYQPRSFPGRHPRGNMNNAGYGQSERTPQNSGDWNQWSAGR
ncbi:hypothetical protein L208DRAFT_659669 [Tricholoma matsutake]|nr:hypothetical protein L208DRAFT_659669 [Tricholoma matsutake 945]